MLRLPMKRAQAIPLYGWQNPLGSLLRQTGEQRRGRECAFSISTILTNTAGGQDLYKGMSADIVTDA